MTTFRHGGPYDRGRADSYYGRPPIPHYFLAGTGLSPRIEAAAMTPAEIAEYNRGYDDNDDFKDWGRDD